jgi:hypothetical protein
MVLFAQGLHEVEGRKGRKRKEKDVTIGADESEGA